MTAGLPAGAQHGPVRQLFGIGSLSSIACPPGAVSRYANSEWFYSLSCIALETRGVIGNMSGQAVFAWHGPVPA